MVSTVIEERITFNSDGLRLSGILSYPQSENSTRAILLCSPHPHFAGNMNNNVISELAKYLAKDSVVLQFDYHGIGDSQIDLPTGLSVFEYWDNIEENKNYADTVSDAVSASKELSFITENLPLTVIGYSFGAVIAFIYGTKSNSVKQMIGIAPPLTKINFDFLTDCTKPTMIILGKEDFLYSIDDFENLKRTVSSSIEIELLDGCDHFFRGDEISIAEKVYNYISNNT